MVYIPGTVDDDLLYGTPDPDYIEGMTGSDELYGGGGNDTIIAGPANPVVGYSDNDVVYGDTFKGEAGDDVIVGGYGNDTLYGDSYEGGGGGHDTIWGQLGNDTLVGGDGNDTLDGGEDNDTIYGQAGNDKLDGGSGNDTLYGGSGNDTYFNVDGSDVVIEDAAGGDDMVFSYYSYTLGANVENLGLDGFSAINGRGNNLDNNIGGNINDNSIYGQSGNDTLNGGLGNDSLFGGSGYDFATYSGDYTDYNASFTSNGAVKITGSEGTDLLTGIERIYFGDGGFYDVHTGDGGNNSLTADPNVWSMLYGGGGNDTLIGSKYNDTLAGSDGKDILIGGSGNDLLAGGIGKDTLLGGEGADKFSFSSKSEGIDIIKDFNRSEGDKIQINPSFGATSLNQFSYNSNTGALFFDASPSDGVGPIRLATIENKPAGFSIQLDIIM